MTCTVAAIVSFLHWMPPPGTVISVPRSQVTQLSAAQQVKAKFCARKYGIKWQIDEAS